MIVAVSHTFVTRARRGMRAALSLLWIVAGLGAIGRGPLPAAAQIQPCVGDCDSGRTVTVDELVTAMNVALGMRDVDVCIAGDPSSDGDIQVDELVQAVTNALNGCIPVNSTPTEDPASTPTPTVDGGTPGSGTATPGNGTPGSGTATPGDGTPGSGTATPGNGHTLAWCGNALYDAELVAIPAKAAASSDQPRIHEKLQRGQIHGLFNGKRPYSRPDRLGKLLEPGLSDGLATGRQGYKHRECDQYKRQFPPVCPRNHVGGGRGDHRVGQQNHLCLLEALHGHSARGPRR